jgi:hypothetical protein
MQFALLPLGQKDHEYITTWESPEYLGEHQDPFHYRNNFLIVSFIFYLKQKNLFLLPETMVRCLQLHGRACMVF